MPKKPKKFTISTVQELVNVITPENVALLSEELAGFMRFIAGQKQEMLTTYNVDIKAGRLTRAGVLSSLQISSFVWINDGKFDASFDIYPENPEDAN